jgi:selenocysteine lyase/cysteine desulfurase
MQTTLTCQRDAFLIPEGVCYMNCSYMSPMLKSVEKAAIAGVHRRLEPWAISPPDFFEPAEKVRALFAALVNGDPDGVALVPAVSYGVGIATANLPVAKGQSVVILKEQFPSNVYPWEVLTKEKGARLIRVAYPADDDLTSAVLACINQNTAIVSLPHIHWITGAKIDLMKVREKTRSVGAKLVVDASQSLGPASFDIAQYQPDFLVNTGYKGLLGPYGLSFLYVAPEWRSGRPLEQGWLNRVKSDDFTKLTTYQSEYRRGARRYDAGERAHPVHLGMAIAALEQLLAWGMDAVSNYNRSLVQYIMEQADSCGFAHTSAEHCSDNMLGVTLPPEVSPELAVALQKEKVYINIRGRSIRLAPHVYNDKTEIDRLFEVLPRYM